MEYNFWVYIMASPTGTLYIGLTYIYNAIAREKQLKHLLRKEKEELIQIKNPHRKDLYPELLKNYKRFSYGEGQNAN